MTESVTIIGSGPSGANAALTLLERGKKVVLYDVGVHENSIPHPDATFFDLKAKLEDPTSYLLGEDFNAVVFPGSTEVFEYPPARNFRAPLQGGLLNIAPSPFSPILSHNKGGLGVAWGANCIPYNDNDLADFPLTFADLKPHYETAACRMSIAGPQQPDDLSEHLGPRFGESPALEFNLHDQALFHRYQKVRKRLQKNRVVLGSARMAIETRAGMSNQCIYCDRCLWGCGSGAIYNPLNTLKECARYEGFEYRSQSFVTHFDTEEGRVSFVHFYNVKTRTREKHPVEEVILAAGALSSGAIFLRTLKHDSRLKDQAGELQTRSLLDTQVVKMPYIQLEMIARRNDNHDFQFNKLAIGFTQTASPDYPSYIHGEILSLSSLLYHPLIESLPFGSRHSSRLFFLLKGALGVITYFLPDKPHGRNALRLEDDANALTGDRTRFIYEGAADKTSLLYETISQTQKAFWKMGCYLSKRDILYPAPGSGIHYAGTIPMSAAADLRSVNPAGTTYAYSNLHVADGAAFPALPSKSITFSLMANAIRVATRLSS